MNTDNMTISGETIDYGPCAFMDAFDPATVFSSIDHGGRYAYGNQPRDRAVEPRPARRDAAAADRRRHATRRSRRPPRCCTRSRSATTARVRRGMRAKLGLRRRPRRRRAARRPAGAAARRASTTPRSSARWPTSLRGDAAPARGARSPTAPPSTPGRERWRAARPRAATRRDRRGDGPRQPRLHPAQPPRRGGAGRRHRRRPRAVPPTRRRRSRARSTSARAWRRYAEPAPATFGRLPHLLRHLSGVDTLPARRRAGRNGGVTCGLGPYGPQPAGQTRVDGAPPAPRRAPASPHTAVGKCMCPAWCAESCASSGQRAVIALPRV